MRSERLSGENGSISAPRLQALELLRHEVQVVAKGEAQAPAVSPRGMVVGRALRLWRGGSAVSQVPDRLVGGAVDREDPIEQRDLEDPADVRIVAGDRELPAGRAKTPEIAPP